MFRACSEPDSEMCVTWTSLDWQHGDNQLGSRETQPENASLAAGYEYKTWFAAAAGLQDGISDRHIDIGNYSELTVITTPNRVHQHSSNR